MCNLQYRGTVCVTHIIQRAKLCVMCSKEGPTSCVLYSIDMRNYVLFLL